MGGMGSPSEGVLNPLPQRGGIGHGFWHPDSTTDWTGLYRQVQGPISLCSGRMMLWDQCTLFSACPDPSSSALQDRDGRQSSDSHHTELAQGNVVLGLLANSVDPHKLSIYCAKDQYTILLLSCWLDGMDAESQVLGERGLSDLFIPSLLKARKSTSQKVYHHNLKGLFWCKTVTYYRRNHCMETGKHSVLPLYNLDQHLALSTLNGQTQPWPFYFTDCWALIP